MIVSLASKRRTRAAPRKSGLLRRCSLGFLLPVILPDFFDLLHNLKPFAFVLKISKSQKMPQKLFALCAFITGVCSLAQSPYFGKDDGCRLPFECWHRNAILWQILSVKALPHALEFWSIITPLSATLSSLNHSKHSAMSHKSVH